MNTVDRLNASLSGRYVVERELGEGGMATVYLARDLKHGRHVALKVLKAELSAILGGERFLNEIQVTAKLQHPSILPLYDSGEADGLLYYVMPFVEGDSLRDKMAREGQLSLEETLAITRDVAAALHFAHERGVVHRDIKPANILLQDGKPLVADFGIALALRQAGGERFTQTGLSLGTPHYMSPEQATGDRDVDVRSDVYSLGAMVYEMLVGEPPHDGKSVQAIVAKILSDPPVPIRRSRDMVPPNVDAAVQKALAKSPADRFTSAAAFAAALDNPAFRIPMQAVEAAVAPAASPWKRYAWPAAAVLAVMAALAGWLRPTPADAPPSRFRITLPDLMIRGLPLGFVSAIAPDGSALAYWNGSLMGRPPELVVKRRESLTAQRVPTGLPSGEVGLLTFSPDATSLALATFAGQLIRIPLDGGGPNVIARTAAGPNFPPMPIWLGDGTILVADIPAGTVQRVPEDGGAIEELALEGEGAIVHLSPLPGERGFLFVRAANISAPSGDAWAYDLRSGEARRLIGGATGAWYVDSGHLLLAGEGTADGRYAVSAITFDLDALEIRGSAVGLGFTTAGPIGAASLVAAPSGSLLYRGTDSASAESGYEMVTVASDGTPRVLDPEWRVNLPGNGGLRVSPDGARLALSVVESGGLANIYVKTLPDGASTKVTFFEGIARRPVWSRDGRRLLFVAPHEGRDALWETRADGVGEPRLLYAADRAIWEGLWSPDEAWIVYRTLDEGVEDNGDILAVRADGGGEPVPLVATPAEETGPAVSPDGRWIAYATTRSGDQKEIFVQPFPDTEAGLWQVSNGGGTEPAWSTDGGQLYFWSDEGLAVVDVRAAASAFAYGPTRVVLPETTGYLRNDDHRFYDVLPNDGGLLLARWAGGAVGAGSLVLVENIQSELRRRVGGR